MNRTLTCALALMLATACGDDDADVGDAAPDAPAGDAGRDAISDAPPADTSPEDAARDLGAEDAPVVDGSADAGELLCRRNDAFDLDAVYTDDLYVDAAAVPGGDGSEGSPLSDLQAAFSRATPGTTVHVAAGVYGRVFAADVRGTASAPIRVLGAAGAVVDGASGEGIHLVDPSHVVLQGLTFRGSASHAINIDDGGSYETPAQFVVLRDITIEEAGSGGNNDCVKLSGLDDFWIEGSDIGGCDRGESIDMVGCHRGVIQGNEFRATVGNGVQTKGGSADVLIANNRFVAIPGRAVNAGGSTGLAFFRPIDAPHEAARIRVEANLFVDVGAESGAPIAFVGCDACAFVHNTVVRPQTWIARILQETTGERFVPSRDGLFANNLLVLAVDDLRTFINVGSNTAPETFRFANNLWFATDRDSWAGPDLPAPIPAETGALIQMDPQLVDLDSGDYALRAGSPATGAGTDVGETGPGYDGRCFASPAAIGAFPAP